MRIKHELDPELHLHNRSTQTVLPQATPRLDQANMENESDSPSRTIRLMIRDEDLTEGLDPDNNIFTHAGVKMPHPEPYSGEANLERFEVFVAAVL